MVRVCAGVPATIEPSNTRTVTSESSPAAVPAIPWSSGVDVVNVDPAAGLVIETSGAVVSVGAGVVSTVNRVGRLVPVALPAPWLAWTV